MNNYDLLIVGAGPAGLCAALSASEYCNNILIVDDNYNPGGQLIKQTHKFFGSKEHYAGVRGFEIADILINDLKNRNNIELLTSTSVLGIYDNKISLFNREKQKYFTVFSKKIIIATGATEKMLAFKNNDLPGIYGAGAVQTLMNVDGIKPGNRVVMVGAGNIGLIVSYQLLQAGVDVVCILEASSKIGGYQVHSSKIVRMGVPILTKHSVSKAIGEEYLESVVIVELDDKWNPVSGSERIEECDVLCLAVGLSPATELLYQAKCEFKYNGALGGHVAIRNKWMKTTNKNIYIAGDVSCIEEASAAMLEGKIAGLSAAYDITAKNDIKKKREKVLDDLNILREGPFSDKIRENLLEVEF